VNDPTTLGWLAEAYWRTEDLVKARAALEQALALAPRDPALRRLRQTIR
jgi:Flp pilus assembly protein TadD